MHVRHFIVYGPRGGSSDDLVNAIREGGGVAGDPGKYLNFTDVMIPEEKVEDVRARVAALGGEMVLDEQPVVVSPETRSN